MGFAHFAPIGRRLDRAGSLPEVPATAPIFAEVDAVKLFIYMKHVFERLGISDASFHTFRYMAASQLIQNEVELYAVRNLLGQKTARMT
jgi:hypothetical protein